MRYGFTSHTKAAVRKSPIAFDNITERFWLLTQRPHVGRARDDLRQPRMSKDAGWHSLG